MPTDYPNGTITSAERNSSAPTDLAETLRQLPKKSAQEALGLPVGSGLAMPFFVATIGSLVILAMLTVVPYALNKVQSTDQPAAPTLTNTEKQDQPSPTQPTTAPATSTPTADANSKTAAPKVTGKGDILDKLGENGKKMEKPNVNPLDKKDDDLLKEIK
jgi:hypothetical protein